MSEAHICVICSNRDLKQLDSLRPHMVALERKGYTHFCEPIPGDDLKQVLRQELERADVVVALISVDLINELHPLLEQVLPPRLASDKVRMIPVLCRDCDLQDTLFEGRPLVTAHGRALGSRTADRDSAWREVIRLIRAPELEADAARKRIDSELELERHQMKTKGRRTTRQTRGPLFPYAVPFVPPDHYEDREMEARLIASFLKHAAKRVLVIEGRSGQGKTALACRALEALRTGILPDDGERVKVDGVVYLSALGSRRVTAPDLFAGLQECLSAQALRKVKPMLRDPSVGTQGRMSSLLEAAGERRLVVLLDNFETVVHTETQSLRQGNAELHEALCALLSAPHHHVKIIMTTQVVPRDLNLVHPERQDLVSLSSGLPSPYAENILREMDGNGALGLRDAPAALLTEARERTDGNPRALEALVGILRTDRERRLQNILRDTARTLPEHIAEVLVGDLFNRLDPTAQQVQQVLAVYGRPVTANAVDYVLEPYVRGVDSGPVLKRLYHMRAVRKEEELGRYYLHSIDREYALARLPGSDRAPVQGPPGAQFSRRVLSLIGAEYFRQLRKPRQQWRTREDVAPQLAEFELLCAGEKFDEAATVLLEIDELLSRWGLDWQVARMHEQLQGDRLSDAHLRYKSLRRLGNAYRLVSRYVAAARCLMEALALAGSLGDRLGEADTLSDLGYCHFRQGDFERAIAAEQQALSLLGGEQAKVEEKKVGLQANHVLGFCHSAIGETALAMEHTRAALAFARLLGDAQEESYQIGFLGLYSSYLGQTQQAIAYDQDALERARKIGALRAISCHMGFLAEVCTQRGEYAEAIRWAEEALRFEEEIKSPLDGTWCNLWLAVAHGLRGDLPAARKAVEAACRFDETLNNQNSQAILGLIALRQADEAAARRALVTAVNLTDDLVVICARNWEALDAKGLALSGLALYDGEERLRQAVATFQAARAITRDAGTIRRALRQMDLLAPADPEGLLAPARAAAAGTRPRGGGDTRR